MSLKAPEGEVDTEWVNTSSNPDTSVPDLDGASATPGIKPHNTTEMSPYQDTFLRILVTIGARRPRSMGALRL